MPWQIGGVRPHADKKRRLKTGVQTALDCYAVLHQEEVGESGNGENTEQIQNQADFHHFPLLD